MPLQGNIRDFSTTQLLNLINLARKTGTLTIFEAVKTGEKDAMGKEKMAPGDERARCVILALASSFCVDGFAGWQSGLRFE